MSKATVRSEVRVGLDGKCSIEARLQTSRPFFRTAIISAESFSSAASGNYFTAVQNKQSFILFEVTSSYLISFTKKGRRSKPRSVARLRGKASMPSERAGLKAIRPETCLIPTSGLL
jgi:hypothetical protein